MIAGNAANPGAPRCSEHDALLPTGRQGRRRFGGWWPDTGPHNYTDDGFGNAHGVLSPHPGRLTLDAHPGRRLPGRGAGKACARRWRGPAVPLNRCTRQCINSGSGPASAGPVANELPPRNGQHPTPPADVNPARTNTQDTPEVMRLGERLNGEHQSLPAPGVDGGSSRHCRAGTVRPRWSRASSTTTTPTTHRPPHARAVRPRTTFATSVRGGVFDVGRHIVLASPVRRHLRLGERGHQDRRCGADHAIVQRGPGPRWHRQVLRRHHRTGRGASATSTRRSRRPRSTWLVSPFAGGASGARQVLPSVLSTPGWRSPTRCRYRL